LSTANILVNAYDEDRNI